MIRVDCKQKSQAWFAARLGIPTASQFSRIVTSQAKPASAKVQATFRRELIRERVWQECVGAGYCSWQMKYGNDAEADARLEYALITGNSVIEVGFIYKDKRKRFGCSPDGITLTGGLETKCLQENAHIEALVQNEKEPTCPTDHVVQTQACMWITERKHWDVYLFHEELRSILIRVEADEKMFEVFESAVPAFCDTLDAETKVVKRGAQIKVRERMAS